MEKQAGEAGLRGRRPIDAGGFFLEGAFFPCGVLFSVGELRFLGVLGGAIWSGSAFLLFHFFGGAIYFFDEIFPNLRCKIVDL